MNRNPLIGQAAGDRIGGPVRMACLLGESVLACGGLDVADVVERYLAWHRDGAFDTGPVWDAVFRAIESGTPADAAARAVHESFDGQTAGTNPAHRAIALGCARTIADGALADAARVEARITHWHPDAGEAAAATATIVRSLLRGATFADAVARAAEATTGPVAERLARPSSPSPSGYAPLTVEAAVHFTRVATSFREALRASVRFAGPQNYCPVLVGAFAALRFGFEPVREFEVDPSLGARAQRVFSRLWESDATAD